MTEVSDQLTYAWTMAREPDVELREYALKLLETAKKLLERDGYLTSMAMIVTSDEIRCYGISFHGYEEKLRAYGRVISVAKELRAEAIVTFNDGYTKKPEPEKLADYMANYEWGQMAKDHDSECIFVTVTGPQMPNWTTTVPYKRSGKKFRFGKRVDEAGGDVGLMDGWASPSLKAQ